MTARVVHSWKASEDDEARIAALLEAGVVPNESEAVRQGLMNLCRAKKVSV
jgi:hypothetical protein